MLPSLVIKIEQHRTLLSNSKISVPLEPPQAHFLLRSSTQIRTWSRPILTGTAPQTEFTATYSKQTMEKFLLGARTAIRDKSKNQEFFGNSKLNRQIRKLKRAVTHRKQSPVNCSNRQEIQKRSHAFFVPAYLSPSWQDFPE